jgi:hypothetical protein
MHPFVDHLFPEAADWMPFLEAEKSFHFLLFVEKGGSYFIRRDPTLRQTVQSHRVGDVIWVNVTQYDSVNVAQLKV